ncbi:glycosyltransferase [Mycobacterium phage Constella]|nr:glycosyltransferase [Mycobacterium phage Constella]QBI98650.1 glycosyltransferase [Mycobacterium phage Bobby]
MSQKLVVAFPLYRQVSSGWLLTWLQMNKASVAGVVASEGVYITHAMEALTAMALKNYPDFDRLVVYEADMIPPVDAFERIASYGEEHDIVGSVYFKHVYPHEIMAWHQPEPPLFQPVSREEAQGMIDNPGLYEMGGVAMGLTSISRRVLENWDPEIPMWAPTPPLVGHDLHFCNEARKQGFKVWLDSALGCGHMSERPVGYADWAAADGSPAFRKRCESWQERSVLRIAELADNAPATVVGE